MGDQHTHHYVCLQIYHHNKICVIYDSKAEENSKVDAQLKKKIVLYLKKNKFVNAGCLVSDIKWPKLKFKGTTNSGLTTNQSNEPSFVVMRAPEGQYIKMCYEMIDGKNIETCTTPIVCQQLNRFMELNFEFEADGFKPCINKCSQWKTMNEIIFLLHKAISNKEITLLQLTCKIEDRDEGSNLNPDDGNEIIVQIPSYLQFETVLALAREEYESILNYGWEETVGDVSENCRYWMCAADCQEDMKVLGYPNTSDALSNGVDQAQIDRMTSSDCICGYFGCQCRYHLKCLMKQIHSGICIKNGNATGTVNQ